jgi:hypothetical protein
LKEVSQQGKIVSPILDGRAQVVGGFEAEYFLVRPLMGFVEEDLDQPLWKSKWSKLKIGHRGSGNSSVSKIQENTLQSMREAVKNGVKMIECDVTVTKDNVPILHHDFFVADLTDSGIPVAVTELSYRELHSGRYGLFNQKQFVGVEDRPFQPLKSVLKNLDEKTGLMLEIKFAQKMKFGISESSGTDCNQ